jgi:hypothetical protein
MIARRLTPRLRIVTVSSEIGRGTTFEVYLPVSGAAPKIVAARKDARAGGLTDVLLPDMNGRALADRI